MSGGARIALRAAFTAALLLGCASAGGPGTVPPPAGTALPEPAVAAQPARLVLVAIDGLPASAVPSGDAARASLAPTLAALGAAGIAATRVQPAFPPNAPVTHATLVTGLPAARYGIVSERPLGRDGVGPPRRLPARELRGRTLWKAVSDAGGTVAALDWPVTGSAAVAELLPTIDPARLADSRAWLSGATARVADLARRAGGEDPDAAVPGPKRDGVLVSVACHLLAGEAPPRLLLLRLSALAVAQQLAGPGSAAARQALRSTDARVGELVSCLRGAGRLAETALLVTGDHGAMPVHTAIRPNVELAAVGLVTTDSRGRVVQWDAFARSNGGSAFVYAHSADLALLARRALEEAARKSGGAFHVVSADEMLARGADPEAWFGLDAEPGWVFEDAAGGPVLAAASQLAEGGYASGDPSMATALVAWGPALRGGLLVPDLRQIDVAPTVARWLGLSLPDAAGRPVVGLLRELPAAPPIVGLPPRAMPDTTVPRTQPERRAPKGGRR